MIRQDLTGQRFRRLLVIEFSHSKDAAYWRCLCDCGKFTTVRTAQLNNGVVGSCGCGSLEAARSNAKTISIRQRSKYWPYTRFFKSMYRNMLRRCYDQRDKRYLNYGGRGIRVCASWLADRAVYYEWVFTNGWKPGLSIERNNVNAGYSPENCSIIPMAAQQNNTTRSHRVEWNGETHTISEWARILGFPKQALQHRFTRNWTVEQAMTQPLRYWPK